MRITLPFIILITFILPRTILPAAAAIEAQKHRVALEKRLNKIADQFSSLLIAQETYKTMELRSQLQEEAHALYQELDKQGYKLLQPNQRIFINKKLLKQKFMDTQEEVQQARIKLARWKERITKSRFPPRKKLQDLQAAQKMYDDYFEQKLKRPLQKLVNKIMKSTVTRTPYQYEILTNILRPPPKPIAQSPSPKAKYESPEINPLSLFSFPAEQQSTVQTKHVDILEPLAPIISTAEKEFNDKKNFIETKHDLAIRNVQEAMEKITNIEHDQKKQVDLLSYYQKQIDQENERYNKALFDLYQLAQEFPIQEQKRPAKRYVINVSDLDVPEPFDPEESDPEPQPERPSSNILQTLYYVLPITIPLLYLISQPPTKETLVKSGLLGTIALIFTFHRLFKKQAGESQEPSYPEEGLEEKEPG